MQKKNQGLVWWCLCHKQPCKWLVLPARWGALWLAVATATVQRRCRHPFACWSHYDFKQQLFGACFKKFETGLAYGKQCATVVLAYAEKEEAFVARIRRAGSLALAKQSPVSRTTKQCRCLARAILLSKPHRTAESAQAIVLAALRTAARNCSLTLLRD